MNWKKTDPEWRHIDPVRINNKTQEDIEFLITETIKGWICKDFIRDLPKLNEEKGGKRQLIHIIMRSLKSVINQV